MNKFFPVTLGVLFMLAAAAMGQSKSTGIAGLMTGEAPPIEKVSRVVARIAFLEDAIAAMLSTRLGQPGAARDIQDAKIGMRVVALRWYEAGQKADLPLKAQLTERADLVFNNLFACDGLLDSLLAPIPSGAQLMPGEKEAKEQALQKKLAVLAKLADQFNKQMPDTVSAENSVSLGNTLAGFIGALASTTGAYDIAAVAKLQPGRTPTGPTLEEQQARLSGVDPAKLLADVQAAAISLELKKQFTELINLIKAAMTDPQAVETGVAYLELLQDNLQLANALGRCVWLPQQIRQTMFAEMQKGLALAKYPPTRTNGLARLSKAKDILGLVHAVEMLPLLEEQKSDLGKMLEQAVIQMGDLSTRDQGHDTLDTLNNFAQTAIKVHSALADTTMPKLLDKPYQDLLKRYETERGLAITQFKLLAPAGAKMHIDAMNACAGDLELLRGLPALLDQIKPFAGRQYPALETSVREAAATIASKPEAEHGPAVNRIKDFMEAQNLVNDYAMARLGDDQAGLPAVRDLSAGQYFAVVKMAESNLSDLFKVLGTMPAENAGGGKSAKASPTPATGAADWATARKRQKDLNRLLGDLQLAVTAQAFADDLKAVNNWSEIEFDPAVDGLTRRFCEAVKSAYDATGKPAALQQLDREKTEKILNGYRPWMKLQSDLIRNFASRLRNIPRDFRGYLSQLYRPGDDSREALGNPQWAATCLIVNEAAYCDALGYLDHAITHLKELQQDRQPRSSRPKGPRPGR